MSGKLPGKRLREDDDERGPQKHVMDVEIIEQPSIKKRRGVFSKEIRHMMYGFGDVVHPLRETVDVMEDVVYEFITEMMKKAMLVAARPGKVKTEDLVYLIRKDAKKYARTQELLYMEKELKQARKMLVDETEVDGLESLAGGDELF